MALELNGTTGVSLVQDGVVTAADLASGAITSAALPAGSVLQVQSVFLGTTASQAISAGTATEISGLSVSITPTSTDSRIMIFGRLFFEYTGSDPHDMGFHFTRNGTRIGSGATDGNRNATTVTPSTNYQASGSWNTDSTPETVNFFHLDSPSSTVALTYKIGTQASNAGTLYINRSLGDINANSSERGSCEIILMEIAG